MLRSVDWYLPTFWGNLSISSSRVKKSKSYLTLIDETERWSRNVGNYQFTLRNIPEELRSCFGYLDVTIINDCRKTENTALRMVLRDITNRLNWLKSVMRGHTSQHKRTEGDDLIRIFRPLGNEIMQNKKHDRLLRKLKISININGLRNLHHFHPHLFSIKESWLYEIYLNAFLHIFLGLPSEILKIFPKKTVVGSNAINTLTYSQSSLNS